MATGKIKQLYPPGNQGDRHGAGQITEDGTNKKYTFQTPGDIDPAGVPYSAGTPVTFDINGNQIGNVKKTTPAPTCTLSASPNPIQVGQSSVLSWTSTNADTLTLDNRIGPVTPLAAGSITVSPILNTLYTITAANSSGQSASVNVSVNVV